jgi:hypothetical protein
MINKEQLLKRIDEDFELRHKKEAQYGNFVYEIIKWWEENAITKEGYGFLGNRVKYKEADCMCTGFEFHPFALIFKITLRPMQSIKDIGSGMGNAHEIKFE